jgi:hypothetical protein
MWFLVSGNLCFLLTIDVYFARLYFGRCCFFNRRYVLKELELQSLALSSLYQSASAKLFSETRRVKTQMRV